MLKNFIISLINYFGYDLTPLKPVESKNGFELWQYYTSDGSFDYDKYRQVQEAGNKRKIENVWALDKNISFLSEYIMDHLDNVQFGLCHGTRSGKEQEWFRKYLNCDVIGTEISSTAEEFPYTIQWDFHETKREWIDAVDFIYSNAFDHSYDPKKCLDSWMSCLKKGGLCILEHTSCQEKATELDPFGAHISQMPFLVLTWGEGKYCVREIINGIAKPEVSKPDSFKYIKFLILQRL